MLVVRFQQRIERLLRYRNALVLFWFPWFWSRGDTARLRRAASSIEWGRADGFRTRFYLLLKAILWPITVTVPLFLVWMRYAQESALVSHRSPLRQFREMCLFIYWYGGDPLEYYDRKLYDEDFRSVMGDFMSQFECKLLAGALNGAGSESIRDKQRFEEVCLKDGLAVLESNCFLSAETDSAFWDALELPKNDLYVKPCGGKKGQGIERWNFESHENKWSQPGRTFDESELCNYLRQLSAAGRYLLQPAVCNHPSLAGYSVGPMLSFRIITVCDPKRGPLLVAGYLALPRGNSATNHEDYGGMVAKFDMQTGLLDAAFSYVPAVEKHCTHPDTGAVIEGARLDCCPDVLELALKAHRSFPEVVSIGWDIVYTTKGVYLLEGNTLWGLDPGLFLGRTPYVRTCLDIYDARRASSSV